jgi:hypothetical protein
MALIGRIGAPMELAAVPGIDEELDGAAQGVEGTREAPRRAGEAGQVVAQLGVIRLDGVRLALSRGDGVLAGIVDQPVVGREGIRVVLVGLWTPLDEVLQPIERPLPEGVPAQDAARGPVYLRDDVGTVFLSATNV